MTSNYNGDLGNNAHLYSTVMKAHVSTVQAEPKAMITSAPNYTSLLTTTTLGGASTTTSPSKMAINSSSSQPSICNSNGLPPQPYTTFTGSLRPKADPFVNPYMRTSSNGLPMNGNLSLNHYSNLDGASNGEQHRLSAGVYSAHQHSRYKTNSLGGGSSSSGVVSAGGSSPGHSPVGSMAAQAGTHV